jgi:hypothetical protein
MSNCILKQKIRRLKGDLSPAEARNTMAKDIIATASKTKKYAKRFAKPSDWNIIPRIKRIRRMRRATRVCGCY